MQRGIDPKRLRRSQSARLLALATLASGVLAACGGGSPSATRTTVPSRSDKGSSAAVRGGGAGGGSGALAFSRCMRANGVPNFPDPQAGGGYEIPAGTNPFAPAFRAAQAKCQKILGGPGLPGSGPPPSSQTMAKLLTIAVCMRQHGVPQFPDPLTKVPSPPPPGTREITDYDNAILLFPATLNLQAPAYRKALTACGAPPLGLRH